MQAQVQPIPSHCPTSAQVQIYWNDLPAQITAAPRVNPKYKKVTIDLRRCLISQVRNGSSIIEVISV